MAKSTPPAGEPYDPARIYAVTLSGIVDIGGMRLRPMHAYRIAGDTLNTLPADKIASAVPCND